MAPRARRYKRKPARIHVTDRDVQILNRLLDHRFLDSRQIWQLVGGNEQMLIKRLRKLFDVGLLERIPIEQNRPMVYGIGNVGAKTLEMHHGIEDGAVNWQWKNRSRGMEFVSHTLAVSAFVTRIETVIRELDEVNFLSGRELAMRGELREKPFSWKVPIDRYASDFPAGIGIEPDATIGLHHSGKEHFFFVEVDRGTMPVYRSSIRMSSITRKLTAYHESWKQKLHTEKFGLWGVRVLFVTKSPQRMERMIKAARDVMKKQPLPRRFGRHFLFTTQTLACGEEPLGQIWRNARNDDLTSLVD